MFFIRTARRTDCGQLAEIMKTWPENQETDIDTLTLHLTKNGFSEKPVFSIFIAEDSTREVIHHPIAKHASECTSCSAVLPSTTRIGGHPSRYGREIVEAFAMCRSNDNIGSPSIALSGKEIRFLSSELSPPTFPTATTHP
ncbi:uncharacterized protein ISCGN_016562 [Ixodes scapularis]